MNNRTIDSNEGLRGLAGIATGVCLGVLLWLAIYLVNPWRVSVDARVTKMMAVAGVE